MHVARKHKSDISIPLTASDQIIQTSDKLTAQEKAYYMASGRKLMWWRLKKHKLAMVALPILMLLYLGAIFAEFIIPYPAEMTFSNYKSCPPQRIRIYDPEAGFTAPFVYGLTREVDLVNFTRTFVPDTSVRHPVRFLSKGEPYMLWNTFRGETHLITSDGPMFLLGTDQLGRCMFSRIIYGSRISLSIGLVGVAMTFILGMTLGAISGYAGGFIDNMIQRLIELIMCLPAVPLWMALAASFPRDWGTLQMYLGIVVVMSFIGWTGLARIVRGKILSMRDEDFALAAKIAGASNAYILRKHLLPSMTSYIIVSLTMTIPATIIGETALSYLNLGLRPPVISWGVLMQSANSLPAIAGQPWLLLPIVWLTVTSLCFNFVGDGLRDAADPYK